MRSSDESTKFGPNVNSQTRSLLPIMVVKSSLSRKLLYEYEHHMIRLTKSLGDGSSLALKYTGGGIPSPKQRASLAPRNGKSPNLDCLWTSQNKLCKISVYPTNVSGFHFKRHSGLFLLGSQHEHSRAGVSERVQCHLTLVVRKDYLVLGLGSGFTEELSLQMSRSYQKLTHPYWRQFAHFLYISLPVHFTSCTFHFLYISAVKKCCFVSLEFGSAVNYSSFLEFPLPFNSG